MHSLSFERREGGWDIYLLGRDKPIGDISLSSISTEEWIGQMTVDGRRVFASSNDPQDIVDDFEAWVAAGMPLDAPLLKPNIGILLALG